MTRRRRQTVAPARPRPDGMISALCGTGPRNRGCSATVARDGHSIRGRGWTRTVRSRAGLVTLASVSRPRRDRGVQARRQNPCRRPVAEIARAARAYGAVVHTDAAAVYRATAVGDHLLFRRQFAQPSREILQRDVDRLREVSHGELVCGCRSPDSERAVLPCGLSRARPVAGAAALRRVCHRQAGARSDLLHAQFALCQELK
jgi:hypothetical protein